MVAPKPRDLEVRPGDMPKVLIIVVTMVGTALLVLNVALIACFVRRRHRKRLAKGYHLNLFALFLKRVVFRTCSLYDYPVMQ